MIQPAMAFALWQSLRWLSELWDQAALGRFDESDESDEIVTHLLEDLPFIARRWLHDEEFCQRMAASASWLAQQIWHGTASSELARCTADEISLHLAIEKAEMTLDLDQPEVRALRAVTHPDASDERHWASEVKDTLLRDVDVELLWMPQMDGIEEDDEMLATLAVAPLRVPQWFDPFDDVDILPPAVPDPRDHRWRTG